MQVSANLILDFRAEVTDYAKSLFSMAQGGNEDSALADGLSGIGTNGSVSTVNLDTIKSKYIVKFSDDLKIKGLEKFASVRIAKETANKVLEDVMHEIEA